MPFVELAKRRRRLALRYARTAARAGKRDAASFE
jgi:hypothetical protein